MIINANSLHIPLADKSVQTCVTSPPYWGLRDYGDPDQLGLEQTPEEYVQNMVQVFREVWRVMRDDGTLWLNLGDSYWGGGRGGNGPKRSENWQPEYGHPSKNHTVLKPKDLVGIPWRVAFALQADGWYLRSDIIWHKPNPMPESVTDRPTKAHEYIFLLSKQKRYYYDADAVKEDSKYPDDNRKSRSNNRQKRMPTNEISGVRPGSATYPTRNRRTVWTVTTKAYKGAHFATFPPDLIEPCIKAGCPEGGIVLDPFVGSGTTVMVSNTLGRQAVGLDLSWSYLNEQARKRTGMQAMSEWMNGKKATSNLESLPLFS